MKPPKSKKLILKAAKKMFFQSGLNKITVEEICTESSVSKMTFYRNFKNKEEIARSILESVFKESNIQYKSIMDQEIPFAKKVEQIILMDKNYADQISSEFVNDLLSYKTDVFIELINKNNEVMDLQLEKDFLTAQKNGELRKETPVAFYIHMLKDIRNKIKDPNLKSLYKEDKDMWIDLTYFYFYGILSK
ncbi:MAG: TetR/AcrR family transcriptional regulator [Flavobacteriaceae bacterium]